jgi:hypothetical protein
MVLLVVFVVATSRHTALRATVFIVAARELGHQVGSSPSFPGHAIMDGGSESSHDGSSPRQYRMSRTSSIFPTLCPTPEVVRAVAEEKCLAFRMRSVPC